MTLLQKRHEAQAKVRREAELQEETRRAENEREKLPDITMVHSERAMFVPENGVEDGKDEWNVSEKEVDHRDTGGAQSDSFHAIKMLTAGQHGYRARVSTLTTPPSLKF